MSRKPRHYVVMTLKMWRDRTEEYPWECETSLAVDPFVIKLSIFSDYHTNVFGDSRRRRWAWRTKALRNKFCRMYGGKPCLPL